MAIPITKNDVARYFSNELDRTRRREIEQAYRTNLEVQEWFDELMPSDEEADSQPLPALSLDIGECGSLAALAFHSVERDEQVREWRQWIRASATSSAHTGTPSAEIIPSVLLQGDLGTLLYRELIPMEMAGDQDTFTVPEEEVPCISPDLPAGRLIIRQKLEQVPSGVVEVRSVRKRGAGQYEPLPPVRVELERTEPPQGEAYWYADVPLKSLIGEYHLGDDVIYCVEAAPRE